MTEKHIDEISGTETTGHVWDGIRELNTPLPRWWLWTFYGTIVFAIVWTVLYPSWPLINGPVKGLLGYSTRATLDQSLQTAKAAQSVYLQKVAATDVGDILKDEELMRFAQAGGQSAFKVYCTQCHGSGAAGSAGYPNLNDDEWLWGGTIDAIYTTIAHGIRYEQDPDTRVSEMPAFGADQILTSVEIRDVANYVASLSSDPSADPQLAAAGQQIFADNCAACHGDQGQGIQDVGAPALNNAIWLYKGGVDAIVAQVTRPQHGVMPAWSAALGDTTVKELAVYVYSLGGGQ
ncbi:MAG TPA: cytochrome-c oxidase, cbb3-type subunit III [Devosiaceae bacterium]